MSIVREIRVHPFTTPCLLLFAGLAFVLSLQVAVAMPPLEQKDERAHAAYAIALAGGTLPTIDTHIPDDPIHYPALSEVQIGEDQAHRDIWTANHPPLYYLLSVPLVWLGNAIGHPGATLFGMRALNALGVALSVLLVGLIARELAPRRSMVAILATGFAASCPAVGYVGGAIYNDGLATAAALVTLLLSLRVVRRGAEPRRVAALTVAAVAAAALRSSGLVAVVVGCLAVLAAVLVRDRSRPALWRGLWLAGVVGLAPALAIGWFYLRNIGLYGDPTASAALFAKFGRLPEGTMVSELASPNFYRHFVGSLWTDGDVGNLWGALGIALMIAAAVGLGIDVRRRLRHGTPAPATGEATLEHRLGMLCWALVWFYTAIEVTSVASFIAGGGWVHARYALPLLPVLGTLVALALLRLGRLLPAVAAVRDGAARDLMVALPASLGFAAIAVIAHVDTERYVDGVAHNATRAGLLVVGDLVVLLVACVVVAKLRGWLAPTTAAAGTRNDRVGAAVGRAGDA